MSWLDQVFDKDLISFIKSQENILIKLIQLFPDKDWDVYSLSRNPNITWEFIQEHPEYNWSTVDISHNPNITWEIIQTHPAKNWNYTYLSMNPSITWDIVKDNPYIRWCPFHLSINPNITKKIMDENPDYKWDYKIAEQLNPSFIDTKHSPRYYFSEEHPSLDPSITVLDVLKNPDNFNFSQLSHNFFLYDKKTCHNKYNQLLVQHTPQVLIPDLMNIVLSYCLYT
jgi:hypothetical protein